MRKVSNPVSITRVSTRTSRAARSLAIAAVASAAFLASANAFAGTTYTWTTLAPGTVDWSTVGAWTPATGYPGSDGATPTIDDIANIGPHTGSAISGIEVINLTTALPAGSIGGLTINYADTSSSSAPGSSGVTLNINTNLTFAATYNATTNATGSNGTVTIVGGTSNSTLGKAGTSTVNIAQNVTVTTPGVVALSGADSVGTAVLNINGSTNFGGTQIKDDGDNINVTALAQNVILGAVSLGRSSNASHTETDAGLHMLGGNITASSFLVGSNNSGAVADVNGANLTITGTFIVGDYASNTARYSAMYENAGTINASNSTLVLAGSTGNFQSQGNFTFTGGTLNVAGIQLTSTGGPSSDIAFFTISGNSVANIGAAGIGTGTGTYHFTATGGTIAATANWSSPAAMVLSSGNITFQAGNSLGSPFNITLSGALSSAGNITKTGGGNLTLSGANTYSGNTTVNAGTLVVNNTVSNATISGTGTGNVTINSANLAGSGTILGATTVSSGSHVAPGNNNVGTLGFGGGLTLAGGSVLDFDFNSSANSLINVTAGTLTIGGSVGIDLYAEGTTNAFLTNGTYNLIQVAGSPPSTAGLSILNGSPGVIYTLGTSAHDITVTITGGSGGVGWAVDHDGSFGNAANWNGGVPNNSVAIFGNVLTAHRTVTLDGTRTITGLNFNSPVGYTVAQGTGGSLVLDNGATSVAVNNFAGPQIVSAPVVLNSNTAVSLTNPTDTITLSGVVSGAGNLSVSGAGTLILANNANTYAGTNVSGNLQVGSGAATGSFGSGAVVNSGVITFNSSASQTIGTVISGTGGLVQAGTGVTTLSGVNTYTGTTSITGGTLQFGSTTGLSSANVVITAPGKLDVNGLGVTLGTISGNGTLDNLAAGAATVNFSGGASSSNVTIQNTGGAISIVKGGTSSLSLGGNNTYTGGTIASAATQLIALSNNAFGTGPVTLQATGSQLQLANNVTLSNPVLINNGTALEFIDLTGTGGKATLASNVSMVSNSNQYRLGLTSTTNSLVVTGTNNAGSATTLITRGNITFASNGSLTSTNSVAVGRSTNVTTVDLYVQDNAFIRGNGISLGGLNTTSDAQYSNITLTGNGTLDAGTGVFSLNNNGSTTTTVVNLYSNDNSTIRGGSFAVTGGATNNSTTWTINSGNLVASASNANFFPASSKLTVLVAGPLTINDGGFNIGIAQPLSDFLGGNIIKTGTGSLTLSGSNTYSGGTTVNSGALYADSIGALGTAGVVVNSGASFGGNASINNGITLNPGSHLAPGDFATVGTLVLPSVSIPTGGTIDYTFKPDGSASSLLELGGSLSHAGATTPIDLYAVGTTNPFAINGNYTLVQFDGGYVNPNFSVADPVSGASYAFNQVGNNLVLTISGGVVSASWGVDADGFWGNPSNWIGGVPNSAGAIAAFGNVISAPRTVSVDGTRTVGQITFANANSYTLGAGAGGLLVLDNGTSNASITNTLGSHTISVPMTLNSNTTVSTVTGATTTLSGSIGGTTALTVTGAGTTVLSGNNTFAGVLTVSATGTTTLSGANSFGGLTNSGAGTLIVSGANTYTGPTVISAGKIQLAAGGTLGGGLSALTVATGTTLDLNGQSATLGSITGAGTIDNVAGAGTPSLTTGGLNANVSFTGIIKNTTGSTSLVKTGTGNLTLSGANTFSGGTTLSSGGLYATNTTGSALGTGGVTLNGGTLGGTGTITGAVTAGSSAHTINPGTSAANSIGKLTIGSLTTNANTTLAFDLATPAGTSDVLAVAGNLVLAGGNVAINSQTGTGLTSLGYYKVLTYTGTLTGSTSGMVLPAVNANNIIYTLDLTHDTKTLDIHRGFLGDANDSGTVDLTDLQTVLSNLGSTNSAWSAGNFDGAATIDLNDLNAVLNHLNNTVASGSAIVADAEALVAAGSPAATPEPASLGLLALGAAALVTRRRRA